MTALLQAVDAGDAKLVRELLESGAQPDDVAAARSPLIRAINGLQNGKMRCNRAVVAELLGGGADPDRSDPMTKEVPLHTALELGDAACAKLLVQSGASVKARDPGGSTLMQAAAKGVIRTGDEALLDLATSWGVDVNERGSRGATAFLIAVLSRDWRVANALLERGADPCVGTEDGLTPLAYARSIAAQPRRASEAAENKRLLELVERYVAACPSDEILAR